LFVDLSNIGCNVILAGKCIPLHQCQPFQYLSTMWFLNTCCCCSCPTCAYRRMYVSRQRYGNWRRLAFIALLNFDDTWAAMYAWNYSLDVIHHRWRMHVFGLAVRRCLTWCVKQLLHFSELLYSSCNQLSVVNYIPLQFSYEINVQQR